MTILELQGDEQDAAHRTRSCQEAAGRGRLVTSTVILLACLAALTGSCVVGNILEGEISLSQEDVSPYCPMPATVRFYLPDLSKEINRI